MLSEAEAEYAAVVEAIALHRAGDGHRAARRRAAAARRDDGSRSTSAELPIDDSWVRDNGPIFVVDGRGGVAAVHFGFNAWGGKYAPFADDAQLPARLAQLLGMRVYDAPLVAEGGGLAFDGEGTLITTESVLLNPNRNPGLSRGEVEELLRAYCGVQKVIWLRAGLVEDRDTDGHSDNIVQFVRPGVVLAQMAPDRSNPNWDVLSENRARLAKETDAARPASSRSSRCRCCPTSRSTGERFVVPYTNYYPVNGGIVAPVARARRRRGRVRAAARAVSRSRGGGRSQPPAGLRRRRHRLHHAAPAGGHGARPGLMIRTGEEYRESLRDGREVWVSGERVDDVTTHPQFKPLVDARARIYDMAHEDATRDVVSYAGDDGERNAISTQLPRTREDWHAKQRMVDAVFDDLGGVVTRVGDETVGEMWSLFDGKAVLDEVDPQWSRQHRAAHPARAARRSVPRLGQHRSEGRPLQAAAGSGPRHAAARRARDRQRHRRARRQVRDGRGLLQPGVRQADDRQLGRLRAVRVRRRLHRRHGLARASSTSAAPASRAVPRPPTIPSRTASTRSTRCSSSTTSRSRGRTSSSTATRARPRYIRATLHRYSAFAYVQRNVRLADLMIGAALHNVRQTGLEKQQAVQEKLAQLACYREGINAHLTASIALAEESPGGLLMPNQSLLYTGRVLATSGMPGAMHIARELCGGQICVTPDAATFAGAETGPWMEKFYSINERWTAEDRRRLLAYARDLLNSDYAGHRLTFQLFAQSPPFANLAAVYRSFDWSGPLRTCSGPRACPSACST